MQTESLFRAARVMTVVQRAINDAAAFVGADQPEVAFIPVMGEVYLSIRAANAGQAMKIGDYANGVAASAEDPNDRFMLVYSTRSDREGIASYRVTEG